jgi:hypothetical protein
MHEMPNHQRDSLLETYQQVLNQTTEMQHELTERLDACPRDEYPEYNMYLLSLIQDFGKVAGIASFAADRVQGLRPLSL